MPLKKQFAALWAQLERNITDEERAALCRRFIVALRETGKLPPAALRRLERRFLRLRRAYAKLFKGA